MTPDHLPATPPAERAIIGCILREPEWATDAAAGLLRPADFMGYVERLAFEAVQSLAADGVRAEPLAVYERLKARGHATCVGGQEGGLVAWLTAAWEDQPTAANLEWYAKLVRDAGDRIEPPADTAGRFADRLADLAAGRSASRPALLPVAAEAGLAALVVRLDPATRAAGVPFGFTDLDRLIPAMEPKRFVVVGARLGVGKSAFALTVAVRAAMAGRSVYFASLEMDREELGLRAASAESGVPVGPLRAGVGTADDLTALRAAVRDMAGASLALDDQSGQTVEWIVAAARRHQRRHGLDLLVVDYLQLVEATDPRSPRREQVEHISRQLKRASRSLRVPVLALVQLNREVEGRGDPRPRISDIREAGGIEQDADAVLLMWMPADQPDPARGGTRISVEVVKQRNGPAGVTVDLLFRKSVTRFDDLPPGFLSA